jgi:hypothetical protein
MEKTENVMYLKSSIMGMPGILKISNGTLELEAHKQGVGGLGILGAILRRKVEAPNHGFKWEISDITEITQGKHGVQKNVLEVKNGKGEQFRILVKNFEEWKTLIEESKQ